MYCAIQDHNHKCKQYNTNHRRKGVVRIEDPWRGFAGLAQKEIRATKSEGYVIEPLQVLTKDTARKSVDLHK